MIIFQFIMVLVFVGAGSGGTLGTSPKPSKTTNASKISPHHTDKLVNVSVEAPSVQAKARNVSKDALPVPLNLLNISKDEPPNSPKAVNISRDAPTVSTDVPPVPEKTLNISLEVPPVLETKNVSKDGLSVPPYLVHISKEENPILEKNGTTRSKDAQPDPPNLVNVSLETPPNPTETTRIARSEEPTSLETVNNQTLNVTMDEEFEEYEEEEYKKIEYTPCGPPMCFAQPKCPAPLQNFSRPLLRGQWIGAAYSKTVGAMIGFMWQWLLPNTTVDFESCMYYEYYINEIDTLKFDIMNRDDSFLYYGYDVRTHLIVPGEWQWESYNRLNKFTVWGAGQINEGDRMYAWVLLVECDSYDEVWGWYLLINSDLYYETDYYEKNKEMFAAKLEELPGLKFADRLEPDPEEPCRGQWTRRNADDPPWEMPDYMRNDK